MDNKVAFVTGGSQVTGKGIAIELAKAGYDVGITYLSHKEGAQDTVRAIQELGRKCEAYYADTSDVKNTQATLEEFFEEFGHIDVMVNNTGITKFFDFLTVTEKEFNHVASININGTYFCAQSAARNMVKNGVKGLIVNISSIHAVRDWPDDTVYSTTKAAIVRMTQAQALDLSKYGIRVVCVAPGYIDTNWQYWGPQYKAIYDQALRRIPLKRLVTAEEIGKTVVFLASDAAGYITGTTIHMDGGAALPVVTENEFA